MPARAADPGGEGRAARRPPPALAVRGLEKRYGGRVALAGVDVAVERGEIAALVGPNGSGKTTLLEVVAGLRTADAGSVSIGGVAASTRQGRACRAVVPDEPSGFDELTVDEYTALLRALYGAGEPSRARADALLDAFALVVRRGARLGTLSRGLRRQVSIVAALALGVPLVLLDEATATLDPEAVVVLREALRAHVARGGAVLLATQDLHFAERICDRVVLLSRGAVLGTGSPADLRRRYSTSSLEEAFLAAIGEQALAEAVHARLVAV